MQAIPEKNRPDAFPLGSPTTWMVVGSLFSTNQWWVGTLAGVPPRFVPHPLLETRRLPPRRDPVRSVGSPGPVYT